MEELIPCRLDGVQWDAWRHAVLGEAEGSGWDSAEAVVRRAVLNAACDWLPLAAQDGIDAFGATHLGSGDVRRLLRVLAA